MINKLRGVYRLFIFIGVVCFHICRVFFMILVKGNNEERAMIIRMECLAQAARLVGIQTEVHGTIPRNGGLLVCNHRSYIDPVLIMGHIPAIPIAKIQVRKWPVIGFGLKLTGMLFVDRGSENGRRQTKADMTKALLENKAIINYAEGTTHTKPQTIEFKKAMFYEAANSKFPIYPVAIEYENTTTAFIGEDTFLPHFIKCFSQKVVKARISYGPKLIGENAEELLKSTKDWIDHELIHLRKGWYP